MVDEAYFGDVSREVQGSSNGVPYKLKYKPQSDIAGQYGVNIEYGLMAGLDPNRALVFALQARGDKLLSRSFVRRHLPISMNAAEEERAVDMEEMRDSLKASVAALAGAIPQMASQGQDPTKIIEQMAKVIDARKRGVPIEDAVAKAFQQPKPEPAPAAPSGLEAMMGGAGAPPEQMPAGPAPEDVMPQGRPPMQQLLAGLTGSGNPTLSSKVSRQVPA
jgi:hypothetical protein